VPKKKCCGGGSKKNNKNSKDACNREELIDQFVTKVEGEKERKSSKSSINEDL